LFLPKGVLGTVISLVRPRSPSSLAVADPTPPPSTTTVEETSCPAR
jgi:urea transport system permease protein